MKVKGSRYVTDAYSCVQLHVSRRKIRIQEPIFEWGATSAALPAPHVPYGTVGPVDPKYFLCQLISIAVGAHFSDVLLTPYSPGTRNAASRLHLQCNAAPPPTPFRRLFFCHLPPTFVDRPEGRSLHPDCVLSASASASSCVPGQVSVASLVPELIPVPGIAWSKSRGGHLRHPSNTSVGPTSVRCFQRPLRASCSIHRHSNLGLAAVNVRQPLPADSSFPVHFSIFSSFFAARLVEYIPLRLCLRLRLWLLVAESHTHTHTDTPISRENRHIL